MKIMTDSVYSNLIRKVSENYPDRKEYSYWNIWKKAYKRYIMPINCVLYAAFGVLLAKNISHICSAFNIEEANIQLFFYLFLIAVTSIIILVVIHESIHLLILPHKIKNAVIIFNFKFPFSIGVDHCVWLRKSQKLLVLISPVLLISIFAIPFFIFQHYLLGCWLVVLNISLACSDIFSFFLYIKKHSTSSTDVRKLLPMSTMNHSRHEYFDRAAHSRRVEYPYRC